MGANVASGLSRGGHLIDGASVAGVASEISETSTSTSHPSGILSWEVAHFEGSTGGLLLSDWRWLDFFSADVELPDDGVLSEEAEQAAEPSTAHRTKAAEAAAVRVRMKVPLQGRRNVQLVSRPAMPLALRRQHAKHEKAAQHPDMYTGNPAFSRLDRHR